LFLFRATRRLYAASHLAQTYYKRGVTTCSKNERTHWRLDDVCKSSCYKQASKRTSSLPISSKYCAGVLRPCGRNNCYKQVMRLRPWRPSSRKRLCGRIMLLQARRCTLTLSQRPRKSGWKDLDKMCRRRHEHNRRIHLPRTGPRRQSVISVICPWRCQEQRKACDASGLCEHFTPARPKAARHDERPLVTSSANENWFTRHVQESNSAVMIMHWKSTRKQHYCAWKSRRGRFRRKEIKPLARLGD